MQKSRDIALSREPKVLECREQAQMLANGRKAGNKAFITLVKIPRAFGPRYCYQGNNHTCSGRNLHSLMFKYPGFDIVDLKNSTRQQQSLGYK